MAIVCSLLIVSIYIFGIRWHCMMNIAVETKKFFIFQQNGKWEHCSFGLYCCLSKWHLRPYNDPYKVSFNFYYYIIMLLGVKMRESKQKIKKKENLDEDLKFESY